MTQTVASSVTGFLGAGGIIIVSVIFILAFIFIKRYKAKVIPLIMGILSYILFCFFGYAFVSTLIALIPGAIETFNNRPTIYIIVMLVVTVMMYSIARIVVSKLLYEKFDGVGDTLIAGLGIGLCEALLYGMTILTMITWSQAINSQGLETIFAGFDVAEVSTTYDSISDLLIAPGVMWLLLGISYAMNIIMNIGLFMIDTGVTKGKMPKWWYAVSITMNFAILLPFQLYNSSSLNSIIALFISKTCIFIFCMYIIYRINVRYLDGMLSYDGGNAGITRGSMPKFGKLSKK